MLIFQYLLLTCDFIESVFLDAYLFESAGFAPMSQKAVIDGGFVRTNGFAGRCTSFQMAQIAAGRVTLEEQIRIKTAGDRA